MAIKATNTQIKVTMTPEKRSVLDQIKSTSGERTSELINRLLTTELALQRAGLNHDLHAKQRGGH